MNGPNNDAVTYDGRKSSGGSAVKFPLDMTFMQFVHDGFITFIQGTDGIGESLMVLEITPYKKVMEVSVEDTAYGNRGEYYNIGTVIKWYNPNTDTTLRSYARYLHSKVREGGGTMGDKGTGAYANNIGTCIMLPLVFERLHRRVVNYPSTPEKVFGSNGKRLVELKRKYDPDNLFFK